MVQGRIETQVRAIRGPRLQWERPARRANVQAPHAEHTYMLHVAHATAMFKLRRNVSRHGYPGTPIPP